MSILRRFLGFIARPVDGRRKGMALVLALGAAALLTAAALELNRRVKDEAVATAYLGQKLELFALAKTGVEAACLVLIKDRAASLADSVQEDWANPEVMQTVADAIPKNTGSLCLLISDELGKIQVNALVAHPARKRFNASQKLLWDRYLRRLSGRFGDLRGFDPDLVLEAMKDWMDENDQGQKTGRGGAEAPDYAAMDMAVTCPDRPVQDIRELAYVRHMPRQFFTSRDKDSRLETHVTPFGIDTGVSNRFTYPGKININTAPIPVLAAILKQGGENLARSMDDYRREKQNGRYAHNLTKAKWYREVPGMGSQTLDPLLVTTQSDLFRIEATAKSGEISVQVTAVVRRERDPSSAALLCQTLFWQTR